MNPTNRFFLFSVIAISLFAIACNQSNRSNQKSESREENDIKSRKMSAIGLFEADSSRKMICTANMDCEVKDVLTTETSIRKLTLEKGGFIEVSDVQSDKNTLNRVESSRDSIFEYSLQKVYATMVIRVPDDSLQIIMDEISGYADVIARKVLKAEDVSIGILANQLTMDRNTYDGNTNGVSTRRVDSLAYDADQALLSGLDLMDKVNYSSISISLKQKDFVVIDSVQNIDAMTAKTSPFWLRLLDSLAYGWSMLETFVLFLFRFWAIIVLMVALYFGYKKWMPKNRFLQLNRQA